MCGSTLQLDGTKRLDFNFLDLLFGVFSCSFFLATGGAGSARDEWLTRVAVLGRAAPHSALPLLSNLTAHRQQQVTHSMTSGTSQLHAMMTHALDKALKGP